MGDAAQLVIDGEDQGADFVCWDFSRHPGVIRHRFRAPRGKVVDGALEPYWDIDRVRCPECGKVAHIEASIPFTRAEFVAMLDALEANSFLWEEKGWSTSDREVGGFLSYARGCLTVRS
jgi:hypothetical protein